MWSFGTMKDFNRARSGVVAGVNDLATTHPDIVQEWDYEKNIDIEPYEISYGSGYVAHWKCSKGHSYVMPVKDRVALKYGCPVCSGKKIVPGIMTWQPYSLKSEPDGIQVQMET